MEIMIVTGMSGAGKSTALKMLEDVGYFCIDNLPVDLMPKLQELLMIPGTKVNKVALGVDIRSGRNWSHWKRYWIIIRKKMFLTKYYFWMPKMKY